MGFDAHTHLDFAEFDADREAVVLRARAAGVTSWILAGSDPDRWDHTARIAEETGGHAIFGVHPWDTPRLDATALRPYLDDLQQRPMAGLGEIGLDALHAKSPIERTNQREGLRAQLAIARSRDLPVAFHCVRAWPELLTLLERDGLPRAGGMMHAWSGPGELVARCLALGLYVSFAPLVLNERAVKSRSSVAHVPDERLLLETDCPNMKPRGVARGEPAHLVLVAAEVARLRGTTPEHVLAVTEQNARRLFRL